MSWRRCHEATLEPAVCISLSSRSGRLGLENLQTFGRRPVFGDGLGRPTVYYPGVTAPPSKNGGTTCRWDWIHLKKTEGSVVFVERSLVRAT